MNETMFSDLLQSVRDAGSILRGQAVTGAKVTEIGAQDVKALREAAQVSQSEFARLIGVSRRTLENWEQNRTVPSGPARALLKIVSADPQAAIRALHAA